ncbi:MAG: thioredoxin family protein [Burkholderiales bacterium]|nr:thioredoxin family protein [Burkholderiales bacterium]
MKLRSLAFAAMLLASPALFAATTPASAASEAHESGIAWYKGDVDAAFAQAKSSNKPLFLYWGAGWCPPCNQVKATIFNRQGFIERSRYFVPVYIDGDSPSAQKLGARFKVRGYPTMILFKPDGSEVTRLPGEVDAARYLQVLTLGMSASHSVQDLLQLAASDASKLSADDWRLLSFYTWDAQEQQLVAEKDLPAALLRLADLATDPDSALRLQIRGWLAQHDAEKKSNVSISQRATIIKQLQNETWTRDNMDLVTNGAADLVEILNDGVAENNGPQNPTVKLFNQALTRLLNDTTLSRADRLGALSGLVAIAKLDKKAPLSAELQKLVREQVAKIEKSTTDAYERQSVISSASHALAEADLLAESDQLLNAELKRSHSPYYFMLSLASNAKKRGDKAAALNWYEQAYTTSKGPATRLQWGAAYIGGLLDLAPQDEARIGKVVANVLQELSNTPDAFYDRNRSALERTGRKLTNWNLDGKHQKTFSAVQAQLDDLCNKLPKNDAERATCKAILTPAKEQM